MNELDVAARTIEHTANLLGWHAHRREAVDGFPDVVLVRPSLTHGDPSHLLFVAIGDDRRIPALDVQRIEWGQRLIAAGARWYPVAAPSGLPTFLNMLVDLASAA